MFGNPRSSSVETLKASTRLATPVRAPQRQWESMQSKNQLTVYQLTVFNKEFLQVLHNGKCVLSCEP